MATPTIASELAKRGRKPGMPRVKLSITSDLLAALMEMLEESTRIRFPSPRYRQDPVAFCREILGMEPWSKQIEIMEAVRDNDRVAIKSGHKVGKSRTAAALALWFYCSYPDGRVVMTSTTARQVDQILWREVVMLRSRGGRCVTCMAEDPDGHKIPRPCPHSAVIDGDMGMLARTGLKQEFRDIFGFSAREPEAVAGISGTNLFYIADEASGIPERIFEAIEGNRAGSAKLVMFGNPTKNDGKFYDAFNANARLWKGITVSSEESPNVIAGRQVVPGLAMPGWIEEKRDEWGANSPLYAVRVLGEFAKNEEGRIFSIHAIEEAEKRWDEASDAGRLFIGLDPAGESGMGDESAFCVRRGQKMIALTVMRGLNEEQHLIHLLAMIEQHKLTRETPVVVFDVEGSVGSNIGHKLRHWADDHPGSFEYVPIKSSDKAHRQGHIFDRQRDALTANLEAWIRDGGALLEDVKLEKELHNLEWKQQTNGKLKVTPKDQLRKILGRSPDRYDALCLAVWEPLSLMDDLPASMQSQQSSVVRHEEFAAATLDPYAGASAWRGPRR